MDNRVVGGGIGAAGEGMGTEVSQRALYLVGVDSVLNVPLQPLNVNTNVTAHINAHTPSIFSVDAYGNSMPIPSQVPAVVSAPAIPAVQAPVPITCARFITGRLRVVAHFLPAPAREIRIHFFGLTNNVRDSAAAAAVDASCVEINLVIWKRSFDDLVAAVHEFPFSLQIPSVLLPSYNLLLSSMPFASHFDASYPTPAQRQVRSYELLASIVCEDNSLVVTNDRYPIIVRPCYPRWLVGENRIGRGATGGGEYNVNVAVPRYVFMEDGEVVIQLTITDGTEIVKNITAVRCYLVEMPQSNQHFPIPIPIGSLFRYKVPSQHPLDKFPLFSYNNPLTITLKLAEARADISTNLLALSHSLVFELVYKTGTSVSGLNPTSERRSASGRPGSVGANSGGTSGSTSNSTITDPLRTISMIHEALDKQSAAASVRSNDLPSDQQQQQQQQHQPRQSKTQRLKASLIVPVRIVHAVPTEDVGLVNAFRRLAAPQVVGPALGSGPIALETSLTVRVGYVPSADMEGVDGHIKDLEDQLRMDPGDQVIIAETFDDGWAVGTNLTTGMAGLFPVAVVKFIPTAALASASSAGLMSSESVLAATS
ncbi:hypothetical protein HK100_005174, partial [Physocladia obscura]